MTTRLRSVLLLTFAMSWTVFAQTPQSPMRPGNWSVTVKMSMPGMEMPPMTQTQCVTPEMLKDPLGSVPKGPGGGDCKMTNYKLSANTATYTMTCSQPMPMTMVGEMKYNGTDAYTGTVSMDSGGQKMSMSFDAKRVGDCAK